MRSFLRPFSMSKDDLLEPALWPGHCRLRHRDWREGLDVARRAPVGSLHYAVGRPAGGLTELFRQGAASSLCHPRHRRHHRGRHPCRHR